MAGGDSVAASEDRLVEPASADRTPLAAGEASDESAETVAASASKDDDGADEASEAAGPSHYLAPFRIEGRVLYPGGGPVSGAEIHYDSLQAHTSEGGRFAFDFEFWLVRGGKQVSSTWMPLIALKSGYQPAVVERFTTTFGVTEDYRHEVDIVLPGPELAIAGRVLDAGGRPASGWRVALHDPTPGAAREGEQRKRSVEELAAGHDVIVETDDRGRFRIGGLLDRPYDVIAWQPGTLVHTRVDDVGPRDAGARAPRARHREAPPHPRTGRRQPRRTGRGASRSSPRSSSPTSSVR